MVVRLRRHHDPGALRVAASRMRTRMRTRIARGVLRVPLLAKLLGANALLVAGLGLSHVLAPTTSWAAHALVLIPASLVANIGLTWLALRPLSLLEATAQRVARGDYGARVPGSPLADRRITRLSAAINQLLDRVEADTARIHQLVGRVVRTRDLERESVARELRDSLAQMVAGIAMQIAATRRSGDVVQATQQLEQAAGLIEQLGDEMRNVADGLYPGTLSELGLVNAIRAKGRIVERKSSVAIDVEIEPLDVTPTPAAAAALYRAAEEALDNVARHARALHARVRLRNCGDETRLEIEDDGRGFDMHAVDPVGSGLGIFAAKSMLALAGGRLQIASMPGRGTQVSAVVPRGALSTHR